LIINSIVSTSLVFFLVTDDFNVIEAELFAVKAFAP
jgi:hypothetical protein